MRVVVVQDESDVLFSGVPDITEDVNALYDRLGALLGITEAEPATEREKRAIRLLRAVLATTFIRLPLRRNIEQFLEGKE